MRFAVIGFALILGLSASASAHGRPPYVERIAFDPNDPGRIVLQFSYGLVVSEDGGASWTWVCGAAYGIDAGWEDPDITITGVSAHTGQAKGVMVNALHLAAKIVDTLPHVTRTPEMTSDREGFIHVSDIRGNAAEVELHLILRDFELDGLQQLGEVTSHEQELL